MSTHTFSERLQIRLELRPPTFFLQRGPVSCETIFSPKNKVRLFFLQILLACGLRQAFFF